MCLLHHYLYVLALWGGLVVNLCSFPRCVVRNQLSSGYHFPLELLLLARDLMAAFI